MSGPSRLPEGFAVPSIVTAGAFGDAVANHLERIRGESFQRLDEQTSGRIRPGSALLLAAAWPVPGLCDDLDHLGRTHGCPFIPLTVESGRMTIGPVTLPGRPGCWRCLEERSGQHARPESCAPERRKYYSRRNVEGPSGYLETLALAGAARLSQTLSLVLRHGIPAGYCWEMDLFSHRVCTSETVPVHDCSRCAAPSATSERAWGSVRRELAYLWGSAGEGIHEIAVD